jgi:hypothetical protein
MQNPATLLKNEAGAMMMVMAVMLLALMTVISISALKTANTELKIAANEYLHQQNFYFAEAAVLETLDQLEVLGEISDAAIEWMMARGGLINFDDQIFDYWNAEKEPGDAIPHKASLGAGFSESIAVHHGALPGSSLDMSKPTKHLFSIYGRSAKQGLVMIRLGYVKAY